MKRVIIFLVAALAIPTSVAFAQPPAKNQGPHGKSAPTVTYVLKGTLSAYTAATTTADGSISITVKRANYHGRSLKGKTLTFAVSTKTRITYGHGVAQIAEGSTGMVKFRAPLRVSGDLATLLPSTAKAFHVIVQKTAS